MKVAIMGVGSLGTIMGALMTKNGVDVTLIDANKAHVDALNSKGAKIIGKLDMTVPVKAITPDQMEGIYDVVFYLVKQTANSIALKQLLPHLGPTSAVCTLQNGVPEDAVAEIVGKERTLGGPVGWGATWVEPGVSMLTSDPEKMTYDVGELDGSITKRLEQVAELLNKAGKAEIVSNLAGMRWVKLLVNAKMSGLSAALGCTYGDILDNEKALTCATHIANETIQVAAKKGIKFEPLQGFDFATLAFSNKTERASKYPIFHKFFAPHRPLKASMLQDLEKGNKTEIDAINGVVSFYGKQVSVPTPVNDMVVQIIKGIEDKKYQPKMSNLNYFQIPNISE